MTTAIDGGAVIKNVTCTAKEEDLFLEDFTASFGEELVVFQERPLAYAPSPIVKLRGRRGGVIGISCIT